MTLHPPAPKPWLKTAAALVFGALIGLWLGHQDTGYWPGPAFPRGPVVAPQTAQGATFQRAAADSQLPWESVRRGGATLHPTATALDGHTAH